MTSFNETRESVDSPRRVSRHAVYRRLAEYFKRADLTKRSADERLWAHSRAGDDAGVVETLGDMRAIRLLHTDVGVWDVLSHWARLRSRGVDAAEIYRQSLAAYGRGARPEERVEACSVVGSVLESLTVWEPAGEMYNQMLEEARTSGNQQAVAKALLLLGRLYQSRIDHGRASEYLERARDEFERLGDRKGAADAIGNLGNVYSFRGEHDKAFQCYELWLRISTELNDRASMARANGNMGIVYSTRDEYDQALEHFATQLRLSRELGDRRGEARVLSNMGNLHAKRWECEQALECYDVNLRICQELGDRAGEARAHGNIGGVYPKLGQPERALESYEAQSAISLQLGDLHGLALARGNMAMVQGALGQLERALENFTSAAETHRRIGYRYGLVYWLDGLARRLYETVQTSDVAHPFLGEYVSGIERAPGEWRTLTLVAAQEHAAECAALSEELHMLEANFNIHVLIARIADAAGDNGGAQDSLNKILERATDDHQRAELHYWLWRLGATDSDHRTEALRLCRTLSEFSPKQDYGKRIAELSNAMESTNLENGDVPAE